MKKGIGSFLHALLYPLLYIGSQAVASIAAMIAYMIKSAMEEGIAGSAFLSGDYTRLQQEFISAYSQQILLVSCIITILIILLIIKVNKKKVRDVFHVEPLSFKKILTLFVLGISMNLATSYALSLLPIPEAVLNQYEELVGNTVISDNFWLTLATAAILVPITEEFVFRGMAFNILRRGMSVALAVILQTIIFAAAHMLPLQIAYVIPTSLVLGLVYMWSGSFIAPVVLHISFNGVSAVLSALPAAEEAVESQPETIFPFVLMVAAFAITITCLAYLFGTRVRPAAPHAED